jgi:cation transport ATPase
MATVQFEINGLTNQQNADRLAQALAALGGVTGAQVSPATGTVTVTSGPGHLNAATDQARAAVRAAGYEVASDFGRHASRPRQRWLRPSSRAIRTVRA